MLFSIALFVGLIASLIAITTSKINIPKVLSNIGTSSSFFIYYKIKFLSNANKLGRFRRC